MSGGGVTPSPTPSVSDTFFWRYDDVGDATWLVNSQGQLVKAKQQVGVDDVSIGYIRNTGGDSVGIEATTLVTEQWGEQRAEFNGSPEADWSITMDGETLSYNGVLTPRVTDLALLPLRLDEFTGGQYAPTTLFVVDALGEMLLDSNQSKAGIMYKDGQFKFNTEAGYAYEPERSADCVINKTDDLNFTFTFEGQSWTVTNGVCVPNIEE